MGSIGSSKHVKPLCSSMKYEDEYESEPPFEVTIKTII